MLVVSSNSYLLGANDIQKMLQNFLDAKSDVKIYDIKKHWTLFLENSSFLFATYKNNLLAKYIRTDYKSLHNLDDKQYYSLKQIYFVIKGVEQIEEDYIEKIKEKIKSKNNSFSLGITDWIFIKSLKIFISTTNSIHYKAKKIERLLYMMEKPIQTEFLKQIPFEEIYTSRPDSAEYIF